MNRRDTLRLLQSVLLVSAASLGAPSFAAARRDRRPIALLVPLSGQHAALGISMQKAASLVESAPTIHTFDTLGTPAGAAAAATLAMKQDPGIILGPVLSADVAAVMQVTANRVPVVSFSNDPAARATGAYVFGITASQVASAILRYARSRGVKNLVVIGDGTPWANQSIATATSLQGAIGMDVRAIEVREGQPLPAAGDPPDAVLIPGSGDALLAAARNLKDTGIQLLATVQALDYRPLALSILEGAWLASPDPGAFGNFAADYTGRHGGQPGALAALAYDATGIAKTMHSREAFNREGLLDATGFEGVMGKVRFRTDGSVARDMAILVARGDGYETVAVSQGA